MRRRRLSRTSSVLLVPALLLALSGCGSRLDRAEIEAASALSSGTSANGGDTAAGDADGAALAGSDAADIAEQGAAGGGERAGGQPAGTAGGAAGTNAAAGRGGASGASGNGRPTGNTEPIVIGSVSALSGPAGTGQGPGVRAVQAWVSQVNARGGLFGHPVKYHVVDDTSDPARHAAAVQDLVENKGVIAFVGQYASQTHQAARTYLEQKRIPVIGGDASTAVWHESPMYFPTQAMGDDRVLARLAITARYTPKRRIGVLVCREASACSEVAEQTRRLAPQAGFQVVYEGQASIAQPDYTAECLAAENANVEIVLMVFDPNSVKRVARSCSRQGFRPIYLGGNGVSDYASQEVPEFEGLIADMPSFPFVGVDHPGAQEYRRAIAAAKLEPQPIGAAGWAAAKLFEKVAAAIGTGAPSSQKLLEGLWQLRNETLGGLVVPLTFTPEGKRTVAPCSFAMRIQSGAWVAPDRMTPTCAR